MKICQLLLIVGIIITPAADAAVRRMPRLGCAAVQVTAKTPVLVVDLTDAEYTVRRVFADIGVQINWEGFSSAERNASCLAIRIEIHATSGKSSKSYVLASAQPYQSGGAQIHVFMDQIMLCPSNRGVLLGYAIAHEIGHVLERVSRHSEEGVMKARWVGKDYSAMRAGSFGFAADDVELIQMRFSRMKAAALSERH